MTAAWTDEVRRTALACGWSPDVAAALARHVGRKPGERLTYPKGKAPRAQASGPRVTLGEAVSLFGLPATVADDFRAAGTVTAEAAAPLLRDYLAATARRGAATAATALRLNLAARAIHQHSKAPTQ